MSSRSSCPVALQKMEEALHDLTELEGDNTPQRIHLMDFLRDAINQENESRLRDRHIHQLARG